MGMTLIHIQYEYTEWIIETNQPCIPECILIYCVEETIWGKITEKLSWEYFSMYFIKQAVIFLCAPRQNLDNLVEVLSRNISAPYKLAHFANHRLHFFKKWWNISSKGQTSCSGMWLGNRLVSMTSKVNSMPKLWCYWFKSVGLCGSEITENNAVHIET